MPPKRRQSERHRAAAVARGEGEREERPEITTMPEINRFRGYNIYMCAAAISVAHSHAPSSASLDASCTLLPFALLPATTNPLAYLSNNAWKLALNCFAVWHFPIRSHIELVSMSDIWRYASYKNYLLQYWVWSWLLFAVFTLMTLERLDFCVWSLGNVL